MKIEVTVEIDELEDPKAEFERLKRAFEQESGFEQLSQELDCKIDLKVTFSDRAELEAETKNLLETDNPYLEGVMLMPFQGIDDLIKSCVLQGKLSNALTVVSALFKLYEIKMNWMDAIKIDDSIKETEAEYIGRQFLAWVQAKANGDIQPSIGEP